MIAAAIIALRIGVLGIFSPTDVTLRAGEERHRAVVSDGAMVVDGRPTPALRVEGRPLVEVTVHGAAGPRIVRSYRGTIEVRPRSGALQIVDVLDREAYLPGTVALESGSPHPTALAVQAIVARTVAVVERRHRREGLDLCDLTHCQTYRGVDGETAAASEAVVATEGRVVALRGRPAPVYFSAACGGATLDAADVWPGGRHEHLRSVPCEPCRRAGGAPWASTVSVAELAGALSAPSLTGLTVLERGPGGVVRQVRLDGTRVVLDGETLRIRVGRALGWALVRSPRFSIERRADGLRVSGQGQGHGVGLCEAGAAAMASDGATPEAILRRYFPGTQILRLGP